MIQQGLRVLKAGRACRPAREFHLLWTGLKTGQAGWSGEWWRGESQGKHELMRVDEDEGEDEEKRQRRLWLALSSNLTYKPRRRWPIQGSL